MYTHNQNYVSLIMVLSPFCIAYEIQNLVSILKDLTNLVSTDLHFISTLI